MKAPLLILSFFLLLSSLIPAQAEVSQSLHLTPQFAHQTDTPYVQYLSRAHAGIVIERADGSDTRILAEGMIGPDYSVDLRTGWSSDGQWLAFTSIFMDREEESRTYSPARPDSYFHKHGFVYHVSGQPSHALDAFSSVYDLHWVTSEPNLLIVGGWLPQEIEGELVEKPTYALVDVKSEIILQTKVVTPYTSSIAIGDSLAIFQYAWRGAPMEDVSLIIIQADGSVIEQTTSNYVEALYLGDNELIVADQGNVYVLAEDGARTYLVDDGSFGNSLAYAVRHDDHIFFANQTVWHWHNDKIKRFGTDGDFSYLIEDKAFDGQVLINMAEQDLMLYDMTTQETIRVGAPTTAARWSRTGHYIMMWYAIDDFTQAVHLYDTQTGETMQLNDNSLPILGKYYDYWWDDPQVSWFSPQDEHLIYATWEGFVLRELATGQENELFLERNLTKDPVMFGNWERSNPLSIYWQDNETVWITQLEYEYNKSLDRNMPHRKAYQVDMATQEILETLENIQFTDEQHAVYRPTNSSTILHAFDWDDSDQVMAIAPYAWMHSAAIMSLAKMVGQDEWLLIQSNAIWPDNFEVPYYRVTNGDISRELTAYCLDGNCATWLPSQVDIAQIPLLETSLQAEFVISLPENILGLAWSPDGAQLAVLWGNAFGNQSAGKQHHLTIWDLNTQAEMSTHPLPEAVHMGGLLWNDQGLFVGGYQFSWAMNTEDYEFKLYQINGNDAQPYPLEIVEDISKFSGANLAIRIYEQGIIYVEHTLRVADGLAYTEIHDLTMLTREILYSTSDGQVLYQALDSAEINILSVFNMTAGNPLGAYASPDLPYPNQKYFAVSANETYVALGTFRNPLQIYSNNERIAGDDYYPWAMSFHPTEENILAVGTAHRVEVLRTPQD